MTTLSFDTLKITYPAEHVAQVEINRPEKLNAMNKKFWAEMVECFRHLGQNNTVRVILLTGAGRVFTAGLDVLDHADFGNDFAAGQHDIGRINLRNKKLIHDTFQESFSILEKIPQPVIVAVHNACIGGGVDLITACDIRLCSEDAWFQVKEIDLGIVADVGTFPRLPKIIGNQSLVRELAYTGRKLTAQEAYRHGLVSHIYKDKKELHEQGLKLAIEISKKSPLAIARSKEMLNYSRDHTVQDGLDYVATINASIIQSKDFLESVTGALSKRSIIYSNL